MIQIRSTFWKNFPKKINDMCRLFGTGEYLPRDQTYTEEKPSKCSKYDKIFSITGHLKESERTHTVEKLFKCTKGDKTF